MDSASESDVTGKDFLAIVLSGDLLNRGADGVGGEF